MCQFSDIMYASCLIHTCATATEHFAPFELIQCLHNTHILSHQNVQNVVKTEPSGVVVCVQNLVAINLLIMKLKMYARLGCIFRSNPNTLHSLKWLFRRQKLYITSVPYKSSCHCQNKSTNWSFTFEIFNFVGKM